MDFLWQSRNLNGKTMALLDPLEATKTINEEPRTTRKLGENVTWSLPQEVSLATISFSTSMLLLGLAIHGLELHAHHPMDPSCMLDFLLKETRHSQRGSSGCTRSYQVYPKNAD
ncbi:hypothetical protein CDL15_Pgr014619 [Punica granatum]|uniref:Uncharacterized protein n=1 Tax=Punica granatum TaxID=22663 RepID=A0A218XZ34_PUNGR|nr:hypothetical protein CDL15_Pgr014619 [Punica granatum]